MAPPTIEDLPDPIIEYILSYLSPYRDLKQCMQVNRAWYRYVCAVVRKTQRDFYNAICGMSVQWCHLIAEPGLTISKRYSHSACCCGNSMYIFGGCTTANTTFNDLWRLDLSTRCWIRPLATGTYPPPKACATLVNHGDNLVLFGGWTHTSPYPLHQVWRIFNQLHIYNIITNRWTQIVTPTNSPAMAGHSATVHGDLMVVFGGIQWITADGPFSSSNDIWVLDLKTYNWQKQATTKIQPPPRYGHSQIFIDEQHLLIMGGCGGPNMLYTDIWLLKMNDNPDKLWEWQELEIRMKENAAPHLAFHPACKVGNQIVVMSKTQKSRTSPSSLPHLLRAPSRIWIPPRLEMDMCTVDNAYMSGPSRNALQEEPCVNGKRGVLKRHIDRQEASLSSQMSKSDEDDFHSQDTIKKKSSCSNSSNNFLPQCTYNDNKPLNNSPNDISVPSTSGYQNSTFKTSPVKDNEENKSWLESSNLSHTSNEAMRNSLPRQGFMKPNSRRNRQRQLEGLDRMEQRLRDLKAEVASKISSASGSSMSITKKQNSYHTRMTAKNPMCLYVLDVSAAITQRFVYWRVVKRQAPSAPEEIILYTLVHGRGELIMFGGIQKDLNSNLHEGEKVPEVVSNSLHFMSAQRFII